MTDLQNSTDATPEQPPVIDPKLDTGLDTTSIPEPVNPGPVATAPKVALETQISWKAELKEIVTLTEDELHRIVEWAANKL